MKLSYDLISLDGVQSSTRFLKNKAISKFARHQEGVTAANSPFTSLFGETCSIDVLMHSASTTGMAERKRLFGGRNFIPLRVVARVMTSTNASHVSTSGIIHRLTVALER